MSFFESNHCTSRVHCRFCRSNRAFRASLARIYKMKDIDFICPQGFIITEETGVNRNSLNPCSRSLLMAENKIHCLRGLFGGFPSREQCLECAFCRGKDKPILPPVKKEITNLLNAGKRIVQAAIAGSPILVDSSTLQFRLTCCATCTLYIKESKRCTDCGCFVEEKARLATETCRHGFWAAEPVLSDRYITGGDLFKERQQLRVFLFTTSLLLQTIDEILAEPRKCHRCLSRENTIKLETAASKDILTWSESQFAVMKKLFNNCNGMRLPEPKTWEQIEAEYGKTRNQSTSNDGK